MDLALNNLQRLICHKTQQTKPTKPNQTKPRAKVMGQTLIARTVHMSVHLSPGYK